METTSATTTSTLTRRTALGALALAFVAIIFAALAATPAGATPRSPTVDRANQLIEYCFAMGGEPVVIMDSTGEQITVACIWDDGSISFCDAAKQADDPTRCAKTYPAPAQRRLAVPVDAASLPQAQPVQSGQTVPAAHAVAIRRGTHLAVSGSRLIVVVDVKR